MSRAKIGHVHLKVRNLDQAIGFYERLLGYRVTERFGSQYAFMTGGTAHHELALQNVGGGAPEPSPIGVGLYHVAFEVNDFEALRHIGRIMMQERIPFSFVDHRISWGLYCSDPDGNGVEIYLDTRRTEGGSEHWEGQSKYLDPQRLIEESDSRGEE